MVRKKFQTLLIFLGAFTLCLFVILSLKEGESGNEVAIEDDVIDNGDEIPALAYSKMWTNHNTYLAKPNLQKEAAVTVRSKSPKYTVTPVESSGQESWTDSWHQLDQDFAFYSAYADLRYCNKSGSGCFVRVIGIGPANLKHHSLECFLTHGDEVVASSRTVSKTVPESHDVNKTAMYVLCLFPNENLIPRAVVIQRAGNIRSDNDTERSTQTVTIQVHRPKMHPQAKNDVAVCVRPLFGPYSDVQSVAEFIAYYSILGARRFTFYRHAITPLVQRYLNLLMEENIPVDILPWDLPETFIHTWEFGQLAHIQDCIYRHSGYYDHVLSVDLDEFVVFQQHDTFQSFLDYMENGTRCVGSYVFRNVFFFLEDCDEPGWVSAPVRKLRFQMCTNRDSTVWEAYKRSKVLLKPEHVITGGIHFIWAYSGKCRSEIVPPKVAFLHHYRHFLKKNVKHPHFEDTTAFRYVVPILESKPFKLWRKLVEEKLNTTLSFE